MKKILIVLLLMVGMVFAQFDKVGTSAAQFLKIGVGARANALAGAVVAQVDDGTSGFWNPAGYAYQREMGVVFNHNPWVLDINEDYLAFSIPIKENSTLGFSLLASTMGDQEVTTIELEDGTGYYYSVSDIAFAVSFGQKLSNRLAYGLSMKYIRLSAYNEVAQTFALDLGSILNTQINGLTIGMALSNFGGDLQYTGTDLIASVDPYNMTDGNYDSKAYISTQSWPLPLQIRIGLAWRVFGDESLYPFIDSDNKSLIFEVDAIHPNDSSERLVFGGEYGLNNMLFLRGGYMMDYDLQKGFTVGGGLRLPLQSFGNIRVDYSYTPMEYFGNNSQFSIAMDF